MRPAECVGLLGVNGAGKSTTFAMLAGQLQPSGGEVHVRGRRVGVEVAAARAHLGLCPQHDALVRSLSAREHLELWCALRGVPRARVAAECARLIDSVGLSRHAERPAARLSGGNKRKLALALALVGAPSVVCLDEPSSGMDAAAKRDMWRAVRAHVRESGASVVLSTHSLEEAEALCERVGIMVGGRLRCLGTAHRLKSRFGDGYSCSLRMRDEAGVRAAQQLARAWAGGAAGERLRECAVQEVRGTHVVLRMSLRAPADPESAPPALSALFGALERAKETAGIDSYAVTHSTLERVFLRMAEEVEEEEEAAG